MAKSKPKSANKSVAKPPAASSLLASQAKSKRFQTKLLAHAEEIRGKRAQMADPEALERLLAAEDVLRKVNLGDETQFEAACDAVSNGVEEVYPLRDKNIFYRLYTRRKYHKIRKQMLHTARITRSMHEDVLDPEIIEACDEAEKTFKKTPVLDFLTFRKNGKQLNEAVGKIQPPEKVSRVKENLEIAVVAIAVALGLRTYFLQPFRIPTGSMQPTLYGQTFESSPPKHGIFDAQFIPGSERNGIVRFLNVPRTLNGFVTGHWHIQHHAPASGVLRGVSEGANQKVRCWVEGPDGRPLGHSFHIPVKAAGYAFKQSLQSSTYMPRKVNKGDVVVEGYLVSGDSILVNKMAYNFRRPERGEIFVFNTRGINHSQIRKGDHYIKRLVGLPGEQIDIAPDGKLTADGISVDAPPAFARQYLRHYDGYSRLYGDELESETGITGYVRGQPGMTLPVQLAPDEYLPMGDNTSSSLDGRYFKEGVNRRDVVGPAFMIYWPFFRFGFTDNDIDEWGL